jgi:hypothetical protein
MRLSETDDVEATRLLGLCEAGQQADEIKRLLRANASLVSFVDARGRTPLLAGVASGSVAVVAVLLAAGADVNAAGKGGWTALHSACQRGHPELVKELLGAGASCTARNDDQNTPLHYAARRPELGEELLAVLAARGEPGAANKAGETPLFLAAWRDHEAAVRLLLRCGASPLRATATGQTPLHAAAMFGSERCCRALLAAGADPLARDASGQRPGDVAVSNAACAALLVEAAAAAERKERVTSWLTASGVEARYHAAFIAEEFDLPSLALVTDAVLASMKLPAAVRLTVLHNARLLQVRRRVVVFFLFPSLKQPRALHGSLGSGGYGRMESVTSDLEEEASTGSGGPEELRAALLARNVPLIDPAELQLVTFSVPHFLLPNIPPFSETCDWGGVLQLGAAGRVARGAGGLQVAHRESGPRQGPPRAVLARGQLFRVASLFSRAELGQVAIMARLRHPNVVQFLGVTLDGDGGPFAILTEYMAGGTLHAAIRSPRWAPQQQEPRRFFRLAADMCKVSHCRCYDLLISFRVSFSFLPRGCCICTGLGWCTAT